MKKPKRNGPMPEPFRFEECRDPDCPSADHRHWHATADGQPENAHNAVRDEAFVPRA